MKKHIFRLLPLAAAAILLCGCERDLEVYDHADNGINFDDPEINFSFIYGDPEVTETIIWVDITTMGFVSGSDRPIAFEQVQSTEEGINNAVPGKHYVPFDDPSVKDQYFVPAGVSQTRIPVIAKRDASLGDADYTLILQIKDNGYFGEGVYSKRKVKITISDQISKPENWNHYVISSLFGNYGRVKHRFMIESTGFKFDFDYFYYELGCSIAPNPNTDWPQNEYYDKGYNAYINRLLRQKLAEYEAENGPLNEDDENKTRVTFPTL